jgi:hypothetical protein
VGINLYHAPILLGVAVPVQKTRQIALPLEAPQESRLQTSQGKAPPGPLHSVHPVCDDSECKNGCTSETPTNPSGAVCQMQMSAKTYAVLCSN